MTARLQAASTSGRPILLLYDTKAGHAGGRPIEKLVEDQSLELAFLSWQLDMGTGPSRAAQTDRIGARPGAP
jgi:prolyl oligopeptidase